MGYEIRDPNGEQQTGFALYQFTMRRGYRCSAAKAFINPIRLRRNLHVALMAHVTRILIDPNTRRAYGVEFVREGVKKTVLARREVILSAGAINTPQLLMLSGKPHVSLILPNLSSCVHSFLLDILSYAFWKSIKIVKMSLLYSQYLTKISL